MSQRDINKVIAQLKKDMPDALVDLDEGIPDFGVISSGSISADLTMVVGGFPRGRITEVSGEYASAKTTLFLTAAARAIKNGQYVAFVDAERALDFDYASNMGATFEDREKSLYLQTTTFEQTAEAIETIVKGNLADLIGVDSVSALIPSDVLEGDIAATEAMAFRARKMSAWLPRLIQSIRDADRKPAVVLVNQLRSVIASNTWAARFGPKTATSGGKALTFYSSIRLEMRQTKRGSVTRDAPDPFKAGKDIKVPVANEHQVECTKNKVGPAYREAPMWVRYDEVLGLWGIDNFQTLLDMANAKGFVESSKNGNFVIGSEKFRSGKEAHEYLIQNSEVCQRLATQLGLDWSLYEPRIVPQEVEV